MCGIAGFKPSNSIDASYMGAMLNTLAHRGPDNEGVYSDANICIGHRRLSILDLNERSNQPMFSQSNRFVISYNGELYNYLEIKQQILKDYPNQVFQTTSDTEVILIAFEKWGVESFKLFNGMFAISIYDKDENKVYLVRDRFGVKPLFFYFDGSNFAFSSEMFAFFVLPYVKKEINQEAVSHYFHVGFIPSPLSIYKSIFKVNAGHYVEFSNSQIQSYCYYNLCTQNNLNTDKSFKKIINTCDDLLNQSVASQLQSDVPVGVFLSGGIDSSLIASLTSKNSQSGLTTFSIGFKEKEYDESVYAKKVAEFLKSNHFEFIVSIEDAINYIDMIPKRYAEPFADSSAIPTLMVSKLASKHVKVVFSGDGGDEMFMGYGTYKWAKRLNNSTIFNFFNRYRNLFLKLPDKYHRGYFIYSEHSNRTSHVFSQEQYLFSEEELPNLLKNYYGNGALFSGKLTWGNAVFNHPSARQNLFDFYHYLPDDLLTKVDRASMTYSVEARVPFLDNQLFEYVVGLGPGIKYFDYGPKYISRTILERYIPKNLFDRPKKGFSIPLPKWINNELKSDVDFHLSKENIEKHGLFNFNFVDDLLKRYRSGESYLYNRIWSIYMFQKWYNHNYG